MRHPHFDSALEESRKAQKIWQVTSFCCRLTYRGIREFVNIKTVWVK